MPRLTTKQYLADRQWLTDFWIDRMSTWAQMSPADQRDLHDFYEPSIPHRPDKLLELRQSRTKQDPSLPQRAGRAIRRAQQVAAGTIAWQPRPVLAKANGKQKAHAISVRTVLCPQPDISQLTRALLTVRKDEQAQRKSNDDRAA